MWFTANNLDDFIYLETPTPAVAPAIDKQQPNQPAWVCKYKETIKFKVFQQTINRLQWIDFTFSWFDSQTWETPSSLNCIVITDGQTPSTPVGIEYAKPTSHNSFNLQVIKICRSIY